MTAAKWNLTIEQGATFQLALQLSTGGTVADGGTPIDLTGYDARMHVRQRVKSPTTLLDLSITSTNIVITDAVNGWLQITMSEAETKALMWKSGVYDLEIESSGGFVKRLLHGSVKVSPEVTRE